MAPHSLVVLAALLVAGQVAHGAHAAGITASGSGSATVLVSGQVPCSNGTFINVTQVPSFPDATVELVCDGKVVGTVTTDANGDFSASLVNVQLGLFVDLLAGQCRAVVTTPLVACNASFTTSTGKLTASLQVDSAATGGGSVVTPGGQVNLVAAIFSLVT